MEPLTIAQLFSISGFLMAFQLTMFTWRISREIDLKKDGAITWFPISEYLNLLSLVLIAFGGIIIPIVSGNSCEDISVRIIGLGILLGISYPFALIGHYQVYTPFTMKYNDYDKKINKTPIPEDIYKAACEEDIRKNYCPKQEKIALWLIIFLCIVYILANAIYIDNFKNDKPMKSTIEQSSGN